MKTLIFVFLSSLSISSYAQDLVLNCEITDTLSKGSSPIEIVLDSKKSVLIDDPKLTVYGEMKTVTLSNGDKYDFTINYTVQDNSLDLVIGNSGYWAVSTIGFKASEVPSYFTFQVGVNNVSAPYAYNVVCRN